MEFVRFLVLILTSLVLVWHNSCAHAVHHQGRKMKENSLVASQENMAPAKMGLAHHISSSGALEGNHHQYWKYQNGKTSEAKTRNSGGKDERNLNTETIDREVMNMMSKDYGPKGKNKARRKPPINNHNHNH